jgi:hypothetical protein
MNDDIWNLINEYRIDKCKLYIEQKRKKNYTNVIDQLNRLIFQHNHYCKYNELLHRIETYPKLPIIYQSKTSLLLSSQYRDFCFSFNVLYSSQLVRFPILNLDFKCSSLYDYLL